MQTRHLALTAAALLLTGHIGGCVYYNTAMYFAGSRYTGRVIGVGMGAAILLQFVVQELAAQYAPVAAGRNLAVLTEAATRLHILRTKGIDPAAMFIARHSNLLERNSP